MNLKHLRYFWAVAHAGSISAAAKQLHLTPQTVSVQLRLFEEACGTTLLAPAGRGLSLTEAGRVALSYADDIFALSEEMDAALHSQNAAALPPFRVGIQQLMPKSLTLRLLTPLDTLPRPLRLVCREGAFDWLLGELALNRLDMVLADRSLPEGLGVRGHSHKLGESVIGVFAAAPLVQAAAPFPDCLNGAPLLLPGQSAAIRTGIDHWLGQARLSPLRLGEFDDSALMKAFARQGRAYCFAPVVLADEIAAVYGLQEIGRIDSLRETFWLICSERRIRHPAVRKVFDAAQTGIFSRPESHAEASLPDQSKSTCAGGM